MDTLTLPTGTNFTVGSSEEHAPAVLMNAFGSGLGGRLPDGLNNDAARIEVRLEVLTPAEGQTLMDFFKGKRGASPFKFTLPGDSTPRKWICPKWARVWDGVTTVAVAATFQEVFDPT